MTDTAEFSSPQLQAWWEALNCGFSQVREVFEDCMAEAMATLSPEGLAAYIETAGKLGRLGRGVEPILIFLESWPSVARALGESALPAVMDAVQAMQKSPNGRAIAPFLQTLTPVARRQHSEEQLHHYLEILRDLMDRTTGSIHGHHATYPSPGLPDFFEQLPRLLGLLSMEGLRNWVDDGVKNHADHPERQKEYFSLRSADSLAILQRERHGTLFADVERPLDLFLRALWGESAQLVPYSTAFENPHPPYFDPLGMRVPDVYDDARGVSGLDRYRATLAHMIGHRRYSEALVADNWSPFQRMAVEAFEDARIDQLLMREYPGLAHYFLALHPRPIEGGCDDSTHACLRHRLAMLSRAMLDPDHGYADPLLCEFVQRFHALLAEGPASTTEIATLALSYVARSRRPSDQFAQVHFEDTLVDYRDDNRHLWKFIEEGDEEEIFDPHRPADPEEPEPQGLPPRHYPEWDHHSQSYRPDWVSLYEGLHPTGDAGQIDQLLEKHAGLAKRLKRLFDLLKPQDKTRIRYQEEGSELDLDIAIRSLIDFKSGGTPDPRVNMSHRTAGRDIAVSLLLDLSESLNEKVAGSDQTVLELSREAVSLLSWAVERLGDPLAIAGFHSNTRHEVRYQHIKGYREHWDDEVKGRLAAMQAGFSTRMGAAMRHAGHYLKARPADKKLMLILTDGRPSDIDVTDERQLIEDARQAVRELDRDGIYCHCISLDPRADDYVADIFGRHYTVIDHVERLPEKLPALFMSLTK